MLSSQTASLGCLPNPTAALLPLFPPFHATALPSHLSRHTGTSPTLSGSATYAHVPSPIRYAPSKSNLPPNHFPVFPQPPCCVRTATPATSFFSYPYFMVLWIPRGVGTHAN